MTELLDGPDALVADIGDGAHLAAVRALIRGPVARALADSYPAFGERVFGLRAAG